MKTTVLLYIIFTSRLVLILHFLNLSMMLLLKLYPKLHETSHISTQLASSFIQKVYICVLCKGLPYCTILGAQFIRQITPLGAVHSTAYGSLVISCHCYSFLFFLKLPASSIPSLLLSYDLAFYFTENMIEKNFHIIPP